LVVDAILNHMPEGSPSTTEAKLLFDANLLDSIGAVGLARLAAGGAVWYHYSTMKEVLDYITRELSFTKKLHFDTSRKLAEEKIAFTNAAIEQFIKELHL